MPEDNQRIPIVTPSASFGVSQYGVFRARHEAAGADMMREGMDLLRRAAERRSRVPIEIKQGNFFEYIEAAKFNADAASKGSLLRAYVTEAQGFPHAAADIEIRTVDQVISEVQAKSMSDVVTATVKLSQPKYRGMGKLVPKGQEDEVRRIAKKAAERKNILAADYADTVENVSGELKAENVGSSGTTYHESLEAAIQPDWYATKQELHSVVSEASVSGQFAAAAGFIVKGAISGLINAVAVGRGDKTIGDAAIEVTKAAATSAARRGATGAVGTVIRHGAAKAGVHVVAKSNVATAIAAGTIEIGVAVYSYARGEITAEQALKDVGRTGASTMSGIYAGAAAGVIFGPVGALIGSVAGYFLASSVYNSCLAILKHARLVEEHSHRIVALCDEACREMEAQRKDFENFIQHHLSARQEQFKTCLDAIDIGISSESPEITTLALADIATLVGHHLNFSTFAEFDNFMMSTDDPLVI